MHLNTATVQLAIQQAYNWILADTAYLNIGIGIQIQKSQVLFVHFQV